MATTVCRHAKVVIVQIPQVGGPPIQRSEVKCQLKMSDPILCLKLCDEHLGQGVGSSIVNDVCPFAQTQTWTSCSKYAP